MDVIYKLAKKGYKPSLIGVHLRDTYGVGKSHYLTGSKILRVLKSMGAAPELPEDLYFMIKLLSVCASIWIVTERTRMVNSVLFSSNHVSIVSHDTTALRVWSLQPSSTSLHRICF